MISSTCFPRLDLWVIAHLHVFPEFQNTFFTGWAIRAIRATLHELVYGVQNRQWELHDLCMFSSALAVWEAAHLHVF